ncbi:MAG: endopeptidase La [Chloroflexi bacterium]|nr:endopeptidase La [Chloroflexota bacterium]
MPTVIQKVGDQPGDKTAPPPEERLPAIPDELAILPLRGVVVFPLTVVPLTVGQPRSMRLVDDASVGQRIIGLVTSRDAELETPGPHDLYNTGTVAQVLRLFRAPDGTIRLLVQGLARFAVGEFTQTEPYLKSRITPAPELAESGLEVEALVRSVLDQFQRMAELVPSIPGELLASALNVEDPRQLVYALATYIRITVPDAQKVLELDSVTEKLKFLLGIISKEVEVLELGRKIQQDAQGEMEKVQRDYYLREQMKAIQRELGEADEQSVEAEEFRKKVESVGLPEEAAKEAKRELERMAKLPASSAEYGVIRTYLDWLTSLPWNKFTPDNLDVAHARGVLEEDHYGLKDIKERILEFLAVRKLRLERKEEREKMESAPHDFIRREREGVILCFVGPPGVGKTSLGQSIARAMGRKFIRMSLGGVRDEAEIRGHRRTYIGALPGRIMQALRRAESRNPVFMLDEVDKLGADYRGDPSSALLEVLDPEQNREFRDHYLDVPFDLSQVMFVTTANWLDTIPGPLRDRMEILELSSYTESEKLAIAMGYLIPRQTRENGLRPQEVTFTENAVRTLIRNYTREAGVRSLEREIGRVCRKVVTRVAEGTAKELKIDSGDVPEYLGKKKFYYTEEVEERTSTPGVATALAWTPVGGDVMFIEATQMPGGRGFQLTGQLGDVMQESARAALSYVRSKADDFGLPNTFFEKHDIHLHIPAGSQPKDGPSAGVTMATALVSLISGKPVRGDVGMTGEITLRGQVLPIGGVKEKVLAAHRAGLKTVILPRRNEKDLDDVPEEIRKQIKFVFADRVDEVVSAALAQDGKRASKKDAKLRKASVSQKKR